MHTIPSMGFEVEVEGKRIYFSSDTFYDPEVLKKSVKDGKMHQKRYEDLIDKEFSKCDLQTNF